MVEKPDPAAAKDAERRQLWSDLPEPVAPEDTTASHDPVAPQPDLADADHEFMIRHMGA